MPILCYKRLLKKLRRVFKNQENDIWFEDECDFQQHGTLCRMWMSGLLLGGKNWYANLAKTLRRLIETEKNTSGSREKKIRAARDRFYKGDIADELNDYYVSSGGFLRKADLESHVTQIEEPVSVEYRGYAINKCNTWTQGPVLLQTLRLLENFDANSEDGRHTSLCKHIGDRS